MNEREQIAWLYRRAGFGLGPGQLDERVRAGVEQTLAELVDPDAHGVPVSADPWDGLDLSAFDPQGGGRQNRELVAATISRWLRAMATTPRPLEEWMRWFWHGHFVSTVRVVKYPQLMIQQLRTLHRLGLGDFRTLLRAVTVDPAMLVYLDGVTNKRDAVNENYGREVLELFALGIGNYTEQDVRAGAEALTGWRVDRRAVIGTSDGAEATFEPRRHDDAPKTYLGVAGVHDIDSVVDAITGHQACAPFITGKLARALLGPDVDAAQVARWSADFAASGLQLRPLVRSILEFGLRQDPPLPLVLAPVPWLVSTVVASGAPAERALGDGVAKALGPSGQVPMDAPNVAGWPGGRSWLGASTTVARLDMAVGVAALVPGDALVRAAARRGDARALADAFGHPTGFGDATAKAVAALAGRDRSGDAVIAVAASAPEAVIA